MQTLYLRSTLGFLPWNKKARLGSYPIPGTEESVNNSSGLFIGPLGFLSLAGPSSRIAVDMAKPYHLNFNATTGNSENPQSPLFSNTTRNWLDGSYRTISLEPHEFEQGAIGELRLEP